MPTPLGLLPYQMAYKLPFEPYYLVVFHPWGCPCSMVIEGDFIPKGVEQFSHSSQEKDLGYKRYSMLLIWE
jgi:hypothetical protein